MDVKVIKVTEVADKADFDSGEGADPVFWEVELIVNGRAITGGVYVGTYPGPENLDTSARESNGRGGWIGEDDDVHWVDTVWNAAGDYHGLTPDECEAASEAIEAAARAASKAKAALSHITKMEEMAGDEYARDALDGLRDGILAEVNS